MRSRAGKFLALVDSDRFFPLCLFAGLATAFAIRLIWIGRIQHPADSLYSDMYFFIFRARQMFTGEPDPYDLYPSCMPFGAHYFYAFQMMFFGPNGLGRMAVFHAFFGALATPFAMLVARDAFRSRLGYLAVGTAVSLWHPQITFVGYFTSELPYQALLLASLWIWSRWIRTGKGAFSAGLVPAVAFTVRPPILMTVLLGLGWLFVRRRRLPWLTSKQLVTLVAPVMLVVAFSATRQKLETGGWRLISGTSSVMRFFADTDYRRIVARQPGPDGKERSIGYFPPSRIRYQGDFVFEGWRCDARVLEAARQTFLADKGPLYRMFLVRRNIALLAVGNLLWPEVQDASPPPRLRYSVLVYWSVAVVFVLIPLSLIGMFTLVRVYNPTLELAALHVVTLVYAGAMYFGEIRYRVPYDPILLLFAVQALLFATRWESRGERQDRWVSVVWGLTLAAFLVVLVVPWPSTG